MNIYQLHLEKDWNEVKEILLEAEPMLSPEDLQLTEGKEDVLIKHLAEKMHRTPEQIIGWIESASHTKSKAS